MDLEVKRRLLTTIAAQIPDPDIAITARRGKNIAGASGLELYLLHGRMVTHELVARLLCRHVDYLGGLVPRRGGQEHIVRRKREVQNGIMVRAHGQDMIAKGTFVLTARV